MAVSLQDLIDITLLDYYDDKVRTWVVETLNQKTDGLSITTREELPTEGEVGKLYIVEDAILTWNKETQNYEEMGASKANTWSTF